MILFSSEDRGCFAVPPSASIISPISLVLGLSGTPSLQQGKFSSFFMIATTVSAVRGSHSRHSVWLVKLYIYTLECVCLYESMCIYVHRRRQAAHISSPAKQNGHLKRAPPDEWMPKQRCSSGRSPFTHRTRTRICMPCTVIVVFRVCVSSRRARSTWRSSESESPLRIKIHRRGRRAAFLALSEASKIRWS